MNAAPHDVDPTQRTAADLVAAVSGRKISAVEVVEAHLRLIDRVNPDLNALTVVFSERARAEASALDDAIASGVPAGPLAGVPFSVKENIDLTWSATTNGWRGLADAVPSRDATIVRRMRAAGAVPIGRGNMPDFGMRWDTDNDLFGRTMNPWDRGRSPGGSSGGDAVAVATGMSAVGLGNDFGGSLRLPAYAVGICGLRPSRGRVPRAAVAGHPVALTLQQFSVNGPLARTIDDLARVFDIIRGVDLDDPVSADVVGLRADRVPRRAGVLRADTDMAPDVAAGLSRAAASLRSAGWDVIDVDAPRLEDAAAIWRRLACTDMLISLDPEVLGLPLGRSATSFLRVSTAAAQPYETAHDYASAWAEVAAIASEWARLQRDVPVLLGPVSTARMGPPDYDLGGPHEATRAWHDIRLTVAVNLLGLPAVALPTGQGGDGMPTGVQLIGPMHGEEVVFAAARDLEAGVGRGARPTLG
ncbi:amidase [Microbacterium sp. P02]|uniref:amidase n=1 Tax=unclassified Microbacterium TaxID=2609290 RepID=UPI00366D38EA